MNAEAGARQASRRSNKSRHRARAETGRRELGVPLERSALVQLAPHPGRPMRPLKAWARELKKPIAVDLFAGCGGLGLGLEQAGYAVIMAVDTDDQARQTYQHNMPARVLEFDLSRPSRIDALVYQLSGIPIDLIAGGPPCQPFSRAGRPKIRSLVEGGIRKARDERAELWEAFMEIVERLLPASVLLENVPDMALGNEMIVLRAMIERLERAGYEAEARLLDAWRHGVPQHRQRMILTARRDGRPLQWPKPRKMLTLRDAISDLPKLGDSTGAPEMRAHAPRTPFQKHCRARMNGAKVVWDHVTRPVRDDDREAFELMTPGTRYSELPSRLRRYRSDIFDDKYNRLAWDEPSRSITAHIAKDGYWYIHPGEPRTLTVREAARIQTFPDHFRFAGTRSHAFRQIGNAVPPALAETLGKALLSASRANRLRPSQRPSAWRKQVRDALARFAEDDAREARWRHPGDPWATLAGIVLADRQGIEDAAVREFLARFPKIKKGLPEQIRKAAPKKDAKQAKAYGRLAKAARALSAKRRWESDTWVKAAALGPQEEALVRLIGLGEDRIVATTAALRVAARLTGTRVDEERRLSEGRMVLGTLVGAEPDGPRLNAALHALGRAVCHSATPECSKCPLRRVCAKPSRKRRSKR